MVKINKIASIILVLIFLVPVGVFAGDRFFYPSNNRVLNPGECDKGSPVCIVKDYEVVRDGKTYLIQEIGLNTTIKCAFIMIMEKMPDGRYKYIGTDDCPMR